MHASVRAAFPGFSASLEGLVRFFYLDVYGLVTIAVGNLVDTSARGSDPKLASPPWSALSLPMRLADGTLATRDQIAAEWRAVKTHPTAAKLGHRALINVVRLHLDDDGVRTLFDATLARFEADLIRRYPEWESWPADAQFATLAMSWAMGSAFEVATRGFPKLGRAIRARDFAAAAIEAKLDTKGNPGVAPRNVAMKLAYENAAFVERGDLARDVLHFPGKARTPTVPDFDIVHPRIFVDRDDE